MRQQLFLLMANLGYLSLHVVIKNVTSDYKGVRRGIKCSHQPDVKFIARKENCSASLHFHTSVGFMTQVFAGKCKRSFTWLMSTLAANVKTTAFEALTFNYFPHRQTSLCAIRKLNLWFLKDVSREKRIFRIFHLARQSQSEGTWFIGEQICGPLTAFYTIINGFLWVQLVWKNMRFRSSNPGAIYRREKCRKLVKLHEKMSINHGKIFKCR